MSIKLGTETPYLTWSQKGVNKNFRMPESIGARYIAKFSKRKSDLEIQNNCVSAHIESRNVIHFQKLYFVQEFYKYNPVCMNIIILSLIIVLSLGSFKSRLGRESEGNLERKEQEFIKFYFEVFYFCSSLQFLLLKRSDLFHAN